MRGSSLKSASLTAQVLTFLQIPADHSKDVRSQRQSFQGKALASRVLQGLSRRRMSCARMQRQRPSETTGQFNGKILDVELAARVQLRLKEKAKHNTWRLMEQTSLANTCCKATFTNPIAVKFSASECSLRFWPGLLPIARILRKHPSARLVHSNNGALVHFLLRQ